MKKFLIAFILLPAISLTIFLYLNKGTIGKPKEIGEKQFKVTGITCEACVQTIKSTLKTKHVELTNFDIQNKTVTLKYDINKYKLEKLNRFLYKESFRLKPIPTDKLEIVDYKLKFN